ncbi:MAG: peptidase S41 [Flavobacteriales bacterium]|nr:MAG: peptidase S41 [Flavobacteriales bacterium]
MKKIRKIAITGLVIAILTVSFGFKSDFFEVAKQIEIYTTLFKELNMYYIDETNPAELTETAIDNMLKELDPYTKFYDEQGVEKAKINAAGNHGGIGAETKIINHKLYITEPYENMPADEAGLKAGDEITKIDDFKLNETTVKDAQFMLSGVPESEVILKINRQGKTFETTINRSSIELNPVPYYKLLDNNTGYISFIKFNQNSSQKVREAYEDLKSQGMDKLILDLRGNGGGLINEAVEITNFFIPKDEVVVTTKAKVKKWSDVYKTKREPIDANIPLVVLINDTSASASEIVAGSLQDLDRAVIIGNRSFGKGLVQRFRKLTYGTQLKLTIAKYYTPSGRCIQELDYAHKIDNGDVPKFSDKKRNAFKTRNGRTVYDGGGIEPDISLSKNKKTIATEALLNSEAIFMYVNEYVHNNKESINTDNFNLTDSDFENFKNYLKLNPEVIQTEADKQLSETEKSLEKENLNEKIQPAIASLKSAILTQKLTAIDADKEIVKDALLYEIIRRYAYKKGEFKHRITHDNAVLKAQEVLNNKAKYDKILQ